MRLRTLAAFAACIFLYSNALSAEATLVVSGGAGTHFDLSARQVAEHFEKHYPGGHVIVRNYTGAGGAKACEALIHASPDGRTFGTMGLGIAQIVLGGNAAFERVGCNIETLLGEQTGTSLVLGSSSTPTRVILIRKALVGKDALTEKDLAKLKGVTLHAGTTLNEGATSLVTGALLRTAGVKLNVIAGYQQDALKAFYGGEVDIIIDNSITYLRSDLRNAGAVLCQFGVLAGAGELEKQKGLDGKDGAPDAALCHDLIAAVAAGGTSSEEYQVALTIQSILMSGYPYFAPPGSSKGQVESLRRALALTHADPAFRRHIVGGAYGAGSSFIEGEHFHRILLKLSKKSAETDMRRRYDEVIAGRTP